MLHCTVLYCTVLYCTVLYYTVLYCSTVQREILEGANFRINGRKAFRINFRILIFVCAHVGMPRLLVWQVHVYVSIMSSFSVESMVRGYHVYKDIWDAVVREEFPCKREDGNRVDPIVVAVVRGDTVIGHVPKKILSICSLYLRRDNSIVCRVTGSRWFSVDLAQGQLEIPCVLTFQGDAKHTAKAKKLVESALATTTTTLSASKKRKLSDVPTDLPADLPSTSDRKDSTPELTKEWVQLASIVLTSSDKRHILDGEKLNDRHINMAQAETTVFRNTWAEINSTTGKKSSERKTTS